MNESTKPTGEQSIESDLQIAVLEFLPGQQPEFFDWIAGTLRERFNTGDKSEEAPKLFLYDTESRVHIVNLCGVDKDIWQAMIRMALGTPNISAVGFVSEAWMHVGDNDTDPDELFERYGSLEYAPGRTEAIVMNLYMRGKPSEVRYIEIKGEGDSRILGDVTVMPHDNLSGRLSDQAVGNTPGAVH